MSVFLNFSGRTFSLSNDDSIESQIISLFESLNIDSDCLSLRCNSKTFSVLEKIENNSIIRVSIPLLGGKGGYGAKLKS